MTESMFVRCICFTKFFVEGRPPILSVSLGIKLLGIWNWNFYSHHRNRSFTFRSPSLWTLRIRKIFPSQFVLQMLLVSLAISDNRVRQVFENTSLGWFIHWGIVNSSGRLKPHSTSSSSYRQHSLDSLSLSLSLSFHSLIYKLRHCKFFRKIKTP